jgi:hypothetical protein
MSGEQGYWSVEECRWVEPPAVDEKWLPVEVPGQRSEEAVQEPVEA